MNALIVVEQTLPISLAPELERYQRDLGSEGWNHELAYVKAPAVSPAKDHRHIEIAEKVIWPWLARNPGGHVVLIGNVPVPLSGINLYLNEISSDQGALPCLAYYVSPATDAYSWTDTKSTTFGRKNVPGDGQFDQDSPRVPVVGSIGQINFQHVKAAQWSTTTTDDATARIEAYRRYFDLNHEYRTKGWNFGLDFAATSYKQGDQYGNAKQFFLDRPDLKNMWFWPKNKAQFLQGGPKVVSGDFKLVSDTAVSFWMNTAPKPMAFLNQFWGSGQGASDSPRLKYPVTSGAALVSMTYRSTIKVDYDKLFGGATMGEVWQDAMLKSPVVYAGLIGDPTLRIKRA